METNTNIHDVETKEPAIIFISSPHDILGYVDENGDIFFFASNIARFIGFVNYEDGKEQVDWETLNSNLKKFGFHDNFQDSFLNEYHVRFLFLTLDSDTRQEKESFFDNEILSVFSKAIFQKFVSDPNFAIRVLQNFKDNRDELTSIRNKYFLANAFQNLNGKSSDSPDLKCVYILQMSNNTVKIGCSGNFKKRAKTISNSSGLNILNWCHTKYIPSSQAYALEKTCHEFFAAARTKGEFFCIDFAKAYEKLESHLEIEESMHI